MVDITSLKARLARLRLGSEFEDKHPELRDPASDDLDKKRGKKKQKKAAQDNPYNQYTTNTGGKRKKKNKLTRSDQKRGKKSKYDITGKEVAILLDSFQSRGYYSIKWNASSYTSGIYFIQLISDYHLITQKVILIK